MVVCTFEGISAVCDGRACPSYPISLSRPSDAMSPRPAESPFSVTVRYSPVSPDPRPDAESLPCQFAEWKARQTGRFVYDPEICRKWLFRYTGGRYADLVDDAVQEGYITWVNKGGEAHPITCAIGQFRNIVKHERIEKNLVISLSEEDGRSIRSGKEAMKIEDLPGTLIPAARLFAEGRTTAEVRQAMGIGMIAAHTLRSEIWDYLKNR